MDYCYHLGIAPDNSLAGNKFGLDKIILVMHYENVEFIYHHFYGAQTDFKGYINKFCSSNYFKFSLEEVKDKYIYQRIKTNVGMGLDIVRSLVKPEDLTGKPIREIINAVENTDLFIEKRIEVRNRMNDKVRLHDGLLKLIAILKKMDKTDENIRERIIEAMNNDGTNNDGIFKYVAAYLAYFEDCWLERQVRYRRSSRTVNSVAVRDIDANGISSVSFYISANDDTTADEKIKDLLNHVLELVAR